MCARVALGGCAQVQSSAGIHHLHTTLSCSCCDAVGGGARVWAVVELYIVCPSVHTRRCFCMVVRVVYPPFVSCVRFTLTCEINTLADSVCPFGKGADETWVVCTYTYIRTCVCVCVCVCTYLYVCQDAPEAVDCSCMVCVCTHTHIVCVKLSVCVRVCMLGQCVQRHTVLTA